MKKIAAVLLAVLLTAGSTAAAFAAEQTAPAVGDVNGDGAVDVMDATEIQRYLAETRETIDTKAADVNRDGAVDVQDITLIQRYIAEFIPNFDAWAPKELTLDVSELTLEVGQQHALTTSYTPEDGAVHFSSGNESVATVDANGVVRAVGAGTATITAASDKGTAAQCTVTVNEAVQAIQLNTTDKVLQAGDSFRLTAQAGGSDFRKTFSSSAPTVAAVDANGLVTARSAGTAVITVTAVNGVSASCKVSVYTLPSKMGVSTAMMILGKGERHTLRAVYDGNKPGYGATFASNNGAVSVNAQTGELTANYNGYATITAKSPNGLTAKCYVTVKNAPSAVKFKNRSVKMHLGESVQFYLYPSSDKEGLYGASYTSDNSDVASVTAGGVVTAKKAGTATITATAYNGKSASVTVTVSDGYSATQKTTTAAVGLRKDASWLASNIVILPKGTAVTVFQTSDDGRWMKAQYGNNYGWIYNRALGAGKNYSSINLSTLPAVADDIVFDLNLNKRRIYNYVYDIGYRNTGNDTTENLCVDVLRYGTGSCYHHAALLNYLYNRCGYETITVTGTDYLTGGDHGWCLSKTSEGWRHVDAQMIILYSGVFDNSNQYFVTDSHISQFFGWNRNGVPAAE